MRFKGGYIFKKFEGTAEPVLREMPVPEKIVIPYSESPFDTLAPCVKEGDAVSAGVKILESKGPSVIALVSPVNGTVSKIDNGTITITTDGSSAFKPVKGHPREPWHLNPSEVFDLFCQTGCRFLLDSRFASIKNCDAVKNIIVNAVHNSPLNQAWTPEIFGNNTLVSNGLRTLAALFHDAEIVLAINKRNKKQFEVPGIQKYAKICVMSDRYPQEHPELLSRDTVNRRIISPDGVTDVSILVVAYADMIQIAEVLTQGRPLIDRIVRIAGHGVSKPGWYRVRIGTTFEELNKHLFKQDYRGPWRIIRGDVFSGEGFESLDGSVMFSDHEISVIREHAVRVLFSFMRPGIAADSYSKSTLAEYISIIPRKLETNVHGGVRPCVQCNYCDEVCPVDIYPFLIWKHMGVEEVEESFRLRPYDCIECGLCDYVCPSKIDISTSVKKAKDEYIKQKAEEG